MPEGLPAAEAPNANHAINAAWTAAHENHAARPDVYPARTQIDHAGTTVDDAATEVDDATADVNHAAWAGIIDPAPDAPATTAEVTIRLKCGLRVGEGLGRSCGGNSSSDGLRRGGVEAACGSRACSQEEG